MVITQEEISILGSLNREVERLEHELSNINKVDERPDVRGYGGKPIPCREGIEIDIPGDTTPKTGTFVISADGPFVATNLHFACRWDDSYVGFSGSFDPVPFNGYWRPTRYFYFYWEYQSTGIQRRRQTIRVPSTVPARAEEGNGSFPLIPHDVFAKTSTVTIKITPIGGGPFWSADNIANYLTDAPHWKMWVGFNGFYLLD